MEHGDLRGERCIRKRVKVDGENCYVLVGVDFVLVKLPYENRPESAKLRDIVSLLSEVITEGMVELGERGTKRK